MAEQLAFNRDCMEAMREFPDGFFDLAVVDPPYGGGSTHTHTQAGCAEAALTLRTDPGRASVDCLMPIISVNRTGGGWDAKIRKRLRGRISVTGILRPRPNISRSLPV